MCQTDEGSNILVPPCGSQFGVQRFHSYRSRRNTKPAKFYTPPNPKCSVGQFYFSRKLGTFGGLHVGIHTPYTYYTQYSEHLGSVTPRTWKW